ncbi:MAG: MFS transporter [Candidatus Pacebacteria bacterium]|nr:MFS transporter [Candidatus Paceibacterota bacterium]
MVKKTINLFLFLTFVKNFGFSAHFAVYVIFLTSKGLNLFEVNLVNLVFFMTIFIFEIPTGAVADVFGRKISYVISCFLFAVGMFIYGVSNSFLGFALAEAVAAVAATFSSGAFQAWLVDKLEHHGYSDSLVPVFKKEQWVQRISGVLGALIGSVMANKNLAFPWFFGGVIILLGGITAAISMKEEYFTRKKYSFFSGIRSMKETAVKSFHYSLKNQNFQFLLIMGFVCMFSVQALNMQWQPFFARFFPSKTHLGVLWGVMAGFILAGNQASSWLSERVSNKRLALIFSQIAVGAGIVFSAISGILPITLSFFMLHEFARGMYTPLQDAYLNNNIPSSERATLISFNSMSSHIGGAIGLVMSGFIAQHFSIPTAWLFSGTILLFVCFYLWRKNRG